MVNQLPSRKEVYSACMESLKDEQCRLEMKLKENKRKQKKFSRELNAKEVL